MIKPQEIEISGNLSDINSAHITGNLTSNNNNIGGNLTIPVITKESNYEGLHNLPSIEGVTLMGDKTFYELFPNFLNSFSKTYYGTTSQWNAESGIISEANALYVFRDYHHINDKEIPSFKLGDGKTTIGDLPFIDAVIQAHMADTTAHITEYEREAWNSKVKVLQNEESLIFTY